MNILDKRCHKCNQTKIITEFSKDKYCKDGYSNTCLQCKKEYQAQRRQDPEVRLRDAEYQHNRMSDPVERQKQRDRDKVIKRRPAVRERRNKRRRERYNNDAQYRENRIKTSRRCRAKYPDYDKNRYWSDPERHRSRVRDYHNTHKQEAKQYRRANAHRSREYTRRWRLNNPERAKINDHKRISREKNVPIQFSEQDWLRALVYFDYRCAVCGRPRGLFHTIAADHWIPLSNPDCPGTVPANMIPLCHGEDGCNNKKWAHDPVEWLHNEFDPRKAKQILERIETYFAWIKSSHDQ